MADNEYIMAEMLERLYGSRMIVKDNRFFFTTPANALRATLCGNPYRYKAASSVMLAAEYEYRCRKALEKWQTEA